jgi:hypothetical protein
MVSIKRSDFFHDMIASCSWALGPLRNEFCSAGSRRDDCRACRRLYLPTDAVEYFEVARQDGTANGGLWLASAEAKEGRE